MELEKIIKRCHDRKHQTLNQRKTVVLPAGYNKSFYHFRVYYADEKSAMLHNFERANISLMPIGPEPFDRAPADWTRMDEYRDRINNRQNARSWRPRRWFASRGIGVYTGETSELNGANWHDIEFTYQAILRVPGAVSVCLEALISAVMNPLVTLTKDGGLRFSCRVTDYVHPNTVESKQYTYNHRPTQTDPKHREVYVKVKGAMDYSVWDARYEILTGSLLEPPVISSDVLFALLGFFKATLHRPERGTVDETFRDYEPQTFDDENAINPLQIDKAEVSVSEKMQAVQDGSLSPLAIKRPGPVLMKQPYSEPKLFEIADILETDARVIGIATGLRHPDENREIERAILEKEPLYLSMPTIDYCKAADQYHTAEGFSIGSLCLPDHFGYVIKDVPRDELLKRPFARGNTCIDPERYKSLFLQGGNPHQIICPKCPVREECWDHGFHSQSPKIRKSDVIICEHKTRQVLTDPMWVFSADNFLKGRSRVCVVSNMYASDLFVEYSLSVNWFDEWVKYWDGSVLGDFAYAMRNAIQVNETDLIDNIVKRVRAVVKTFEGAEEALVEQMCQVNVAVEGSPCIGMSMKDAAAFGIVDISTPESIKKGQKTFSNPNWTYWHSLKMFFDHYTRDADAPMRYEESHLQFWVPPVLHPGVKKLVVLSPSLCEEHLRKVFANEKVAVYDLDTKETLAGNRVYQLRSEVHSPHSILNYDLDWDALGLSSIGTRFAISAHREVGRLSETQHTLILHDDMKEILEGTLKHANVKSMNSCRYIPENAEVLKTQFERADVIWVFGAPHWPPHLIWKHAKILYGDAAELLDYSVSMNPYVFKDERLQMISEQYTIQALMGMLTYAGLQDSGKTIVLKTALHVPGFTDAPETTLFDWEDFEIAGGLDKLSETIARREAFEAEAVKIDETWLPYPVMQVLGVDRNEANRILREEHGRKGSVTIREEILALIKEGKAKLKDIVDAIPDRHLSAVQNEVKRMRDEGVIVRAGWGIYSLPEDEIKN